jgi:hypothetical protein
MMRAPIFCVLCLLIANIVNNHVLSTYESPVRDSSGTLVDTRDR